MASALALPMPVRVDCRVIASTWFRSSFATGCVVTMTVEGGESVVGAALKEKETQANSGSKR
ncbi:hypothetical protein D3C78_1677920 [compost metagenome]